MRKNRPPAAAGGFSFLLSSHLEHFSSSSHQGAVNRHLLLSPRSFLLISFPLHTFPLFSFSSIFPLFLPPNLFSSLLFPIFIPPGRKNEQRREKPAAEEICVFSNYGFWKACILREAEERRQFFLLRNRTFRMIISEFPFQNFSLFSAGDTQSWHILHSLQSRSSQCCTRSAKAETAVQYKGIKTEKLENMEKKPGKNPKNVKNPRSSNGAQAKLR